LPLFRINQDNEEDSEDKKKDILIDISEEKSSVTESKKS